MKLANDNAVVMQLVKTKMCAFFERGKCASANCRYAHSATELRSSPNLQKTKLCRAFLNGGCNVGENCGFAHGEGDLRVTHGIYKTQICNFYERGYCKKGDRCNHAHGGIDLRPATPSTAATTPLGKMSPSSTGGDSTKPRRSPLPLSELLVIDSEANSTPQYGMVPPTPTKSVTELAQMAYSPAHSPPMWAQYGMHPLSPMGGVGPVSDLSAMWPPRDAVDMLVQDPNQHMLLSPQHHHMGMSPHHMGMSPLSTNMMYSMDTMDHSVEAMMEHQLMEHSTPARALELVSLDPRTTPPGLAMPPTGTPPRHHATTPCAPTMLGGYAFTEPPRQPPSAMLLSAATSSPAPPGLEEPQAPQPPPAGEAQRDPLMVNLSERLASLDAVVMGLGSDIASFKSDPSKKLHRI